MKAVLYRWQATHLALALWRHFQGLQAFEQAEVLTMSGQNRQLEPVLSVPVPQLPEFKIPDHIVSLSASAYDAAVKAMTQPAFESFGHYIAKSRASHLYGVKVRAKPGGPYVSLEAHENIAPDLRRAAYTLLRHAERPPAERLEQIWLEYEAAADLWAA